MRVLMDNHPGFKRAVPNRLSVVPDVHPHSGSLTVRGRREISVIYARAILCVEVDEIISNTSLTVVVDLKITSTFVKAELVQQIVIDVPGIEQLCDRGIGVLLVVRLVE